MALRAASPRPPRPYPCATGTPTTATIRQYLNDNKVPQLFVSTGAAMFSDPEHFPWTMGIIPNYQTEAHIFAGHILATKPDAKIAVLYQNDSFGKDYGLTIADGPFAGLLARAVVVIGADGNVAYEELVPEIAQEPNYDAALAALSGSA